MFDRLKRFVPAQETLRRSRWLRWLGPALYDPRLWRMSRRGVALGMALGVFFGLLVPIAQIPLAAGAAVVLRANVPTAIASTLVTNPVTFGPLYFVAWRIGTAVLGEPGEPGPAEMEAGAPAQAGARADETWLERMRRQVAGIGKPLLVGLPILATVVGLLTYAAVSGIWYLKVAWSWRARRRRSER
ncbi:MAG: DUF2062 domain-containing protein [bacterium]|jgi:hypothetical protein|nr:DUF2062 domain-containing protein [Betaproteobacteria bacterium]